jgi:hypothetical protein
LADAGGYIKEITKSLKSGLGVYEAAIPLLAQLGGAYVTFGADIMIGTAALTMMTAELQVLAPILEQFVTTFGRFSFTVLPQFFSLLPQWWELIVVWWMLIPVANKMADIMMLYALWGPLAGAGLLLMAEGMNAFADALQKISLAVITALSKMFKVMKFTFGYGIYWQMRELGWGLRRVAWAIDRIRHDKAQAMGNMMEGMAKALPIIEAHPDAPEQIVRIVEGIDEVDVAAFGKITPLLATVAESGEKGGGESPAPAGAAAPPGATSTAGAAAAPTTIILNIDGREFGRAVTKSLNEVNDMSVG